MLGCVGPGEVALTGCENTPQRCSVDSGHAEK